MTTEQTNKANMSTTLTEAERLILSAQYEILARLSTNEEDKSNYLGCKEALDQNCQHKIDNLFSEIEDGIDIEQCDEVHEILKMYCNLKSADDVFEDKTSSIKFPGFDGNHETKLMNYAQYLCNTPKYEYLNKEKRELDTHWPMLEKYRAMLKVWKSKADKLTKDDIKEIIASEAESNKRN